jgi:cystathionine beta-synthase
VKTAMTSDLHTLQAAQPPQALLPLFERNEVAIVLDDQEFIGLVTRIDFINYMRLNP